MRTLVIDCTTQALSIALVGEDMRPDNAHSNDDGSNDDGSNYRYQLMGRGHAEMLVPMIQEMLAGRRADAIAVDVGPGSFTGIRVGIAAARALGFAWGVPVTGYDCLSLCAAMVRDDRARQDGIAADEPITIVMTGGHGELFWQRFEADTLHILHPLTSTPVADLARDLGDARLHGSGAATLVEARGWGEASDCLPDARRYSLLSPARRALPPVAIYGREADAKPMASAVPAISAAGA
ncbi:MAG TPA: tRNA (adenosine(37)-N6)-threonylcarbamoyltransferase complex dimerization subunit type 1 TsaB [Sphingobium sp.]